MIILTGASGGVGQEILPYLLKLDNVIGIYNTSPPTTPPNNRLTFEQLNLEEPAEIKSFAKKWQSELSKVTLIHCATLKIDGLAANYTESDWDHVMNINLRGNFLLTQALLPHMINECWGRIIHFSSLGGIQGSASTIAYSTSKTGLIGMSRVLAKEYARFNITSNIIVLGYFEMGLFHELPEDLKRKLQEQIPSKTFGKPSNIANAIEFLIESEYVNGSTIHIDGGI